jgi:WD40 repeat protein
MKTNYSMAYAIMVFIAAAGSVRAATLIGSDNSGVLYDINVNTGLATNPRPTGLPDLVGITFGPNGKLYGLTAFAVSPANTLFSINPTTGAATQIGATGLVNIFEGDLDFDPTTGLLYGVQNVPTSDSRQLFRIDPATGHATVVGSLGTSGDFSAMAFSPSGVLYVLSTSAERLLQVDKSTGATITDVTVPTLLGSTAGMDFNPADGKLYVADGGTSTAGTNKLYTMNTTTGVLTTVGATGVVNGIEGLAFTVPEPSSFALAALAAIAALRHRRR